MQKTKEKVGVQIPNFPQAQWHIQCGAKPTKLKASKPKPDAKLLQINWCLYPDARQTNSLTMTHT